jgi:hypothetical protein
MLSAIVKACKSFFHHVKESIKKIPKPETAVLTAGTVSDTCPDNIIRPIRFLA